MTSDEARRAALREKVAKKLCQEKCAFYGEPPCWELDPDEYVIQPWNPDTCDEPGCGALADAAIAVVLEEVAAMIEARHGYGMSRQITKEVSAMKGNSND